MPHSRSLADVDAVADAVRAMPLAAALVDLETGRVELVNDAAIEMGGLEPADQYVGRASTEVVDPRDAQSSEQALTTLAAGAVTGYVARRRLVGSEDTATRLWVRALHIDDGRYALVVLEPPPSMRPLVSDMLESTIAVVGVVGGDGRVERLADDIAELGIDSATAIGRPLRELVDPDDRAILDAALDTPCEGPGPVLHLRIGAGSAPWRPARCVLAGNGWRPGERRAFLLLDAGHAPDEALSSARVEELEQHLRRIAAEVRAAGVTEQLQESVDALHHLSPRQWEIVTRLLRGERVPGIASALYLSPHTVRNHLAAVFRKYQVHSQAELVAALRST